MTSSKITEALENLGDVITEYAINYDSPFPRAHFPDVEAAIIVYTAALAEEAEHQKARAWHEGYHTGKRDYAGSITGGVPISTPNPYRGQS